MSAPVIIYLVELESVVLRDDFNKERSEKKASGQMQLVPVQSTIANVFGNGLNGFICRDIGFIPLVAKMQKAI